MPRVAAWIVGHQLPRAITSDSRGITILHATGGMEVIELSRLGIPEVKAGLFWASLTVQRGGEEGGVVVRYLKKSDAYAVASHVAKWKAQLYATRIAPMAELVISRAKRLSRSLSGSGYLNERTIQTLVRSTDDLIVQVAILREWYGTHPAALEAANQIWEFRQNPTAVKDRLNEAYVAAAIEALGTIDGSLTPAQREAVVTEEDATLVLAGAGSGKTKVILARIKYLLDRDVPASEILAVTFNSDAAKEIRKRLRVLELPEVEVRTFHSLGRSVLKNVGKNIDDTDDDEDVAPTPILSPLARNEEKRNEFVYRELRELYNDPAFREIILAYFYESFNDYIDPFTIKTKAEYWAYLKNCRLRTLNGDHVRSHEECAIGNYLYVNGIEHAYERPHPKRMDRSRRGRGIYRPDFLLTKYRIWIEHYCVNKAETRAPHFINSDEYIDIMRNKRKFHDAHKATEGECVETFSWQMREGTLFDTLRQKLESTHGVKFQPIPFDAIFTKFNETIGKNRFAVAIRRFMDQAKAAELDVAHLRQRVALTGDRRRALAFLNIYEAVRHRYDLELERNDHIDFSDMITQARMEVEAGRYRKEFSHILVDEFQDIAGSRARLISSIARRHTDCRIFCVGDDWQAINRFAGADLSILRHMERYFGFKKEVYLDRTFRFNDAIGRVSTKFIEENPDQFRKAITCNSTVDGPRVFIDRAKGSKSAGLAAALQQIRCFLTDIHAVESTDVSVLLLARNNDQKPDLDDLQKKFPEFGLEFKTVHKSKGLEADFVVVFGLSANENAFPSQWSDDSLMRMVLPPQDLYEDADERRLFYVALTRARHAVWLIADSEAPSSFVTELAQYGHDVACRYPSEPPPLKCPHCRVGDLIPRRGGQGYVCSSHHFCETWVPDCPSGHKASVGWDPAINEHRCLVRGCTLDDLTCPSCTAAPLTRRETAGGKIFVGCTGFPECRYSHAAV